MNQQLSKIDAIKHLIFGEEIQRIEDRLESQEVQLSRIEDQLIDFKKTIEKKFDSSTKEMNSKIVSFDDKMSKNIEKSLKTISKDFEKELSQVKKSNVDDRSKIAETIIKFGNSLKK